MTGQRNLSQVLADYPHLTIEGFDNPQRPGFEEARERLADATDQIDRAVAWLRLLPRTKAARWSSYWLKHVAEDWAGAYVANGCLVAAALMLGIGVERYPGSRLNPAIAVAAPGRWPEEAIPGDTSTVWLGGRRRRRVNA
jgi:hypothetical protein